MRRIRKPPTDWRLVTAWCATCWWKSEQQFHNTSKADAIKDEMQRHHDKAGNCREKPVRVEIPEEAKKNA